MKRASKKLTLNRETVKNLQEELLLPVKGGESHTCYSAGSCPRVSCHDCYTH